MARSPLSGFLERPGLPGEFGALMDLCAKAAGEFCAAVETLDGKSFAAERASNDADPRSPLALRLRHRRRREPWSGGRHEARP